MGYLAYKKKCEQCGTFFKPIKATNRYCEKCIIKVEKKYKLKFDEIE